MADITTEGALLHVDPFECCMWEGHDRLPEYINERSCREVIESFSKAGQRHPVLARPASPKDGVKYELIYGARRLFAARHLRVPLLAYVRPISNPAAFIEMDVENRLRSDISPYERAMSFKAWLGARYFRSQEEIAKTLGMSPAHVSRLMKFSELPAAIVAAFPDPRQIREAWAVALAERCANPITRPRMLAIARTLQTRTEQPADSKQVYRRLLACHERAGASRIGARDDIVRAADGSSLFRVSYRHNDLHVIIRRDFASDAVIRELTEVTRQLLTKTTTHRKTHA